MKTNALDDRTILLFILLLIFFLVSPWFKSPSYIITILAVAFGWLLHEYSVVRRTTELEKKNKVLLGKSLRAELNAFYSHYYGNFGKHIRNADPTATPPKFALMGPSGAYFTVFDNSSHFLGSFDDVIAMDIIETYMIAKVIVDKLYYYQTLTEEITPMSPANLCEEAEKKIDQNRWRARQRAEALNSERSQLFVAIRGKDREFEEIFKRTISNLMDVK